MTTFADVLAALAGAPSLPGARCRGKSHTFDPAHPDERPTTTEARHAQALGLCQRCPALDRCANWLESLPSCKRPLGVIAGRVRVPRERNAT